MDLLWRIKVNHIDCYSQQIMAEKAISQTFLWALLLIKRDEIFISFFVRLLNATWQQINFKCTLLEEIIAYVYMHTDIPTYEIAVLKKQQLM